MITPVFNAQTCGTLPCEPYLVAEVGQAQVEQEVVGHADEVEAGGCSALAEWL